MEFQFKNKYIGYICFAVVVLLLGNAVFQTFRPHDKEFEAAMSSYQQVVADANKTISEAQKSRKNAEEEFENIDADFIVLVTFADKYYALSQELQLSDSDKNMLEYYYNYVTEYGIDLSGRIDEATKAYHGSKEDLEELMIAQFKRLYVQAAEELLPEAMKQNIKLQEALAKIEEALPETQK